MQNKMKSPPKSNTDIYKYMNLESDNNIKFSSFKKNSDNKYLFETLTNSNGINELFNKKYKAFEALESLLLNDNVHNKEIEVKKPKSKSNKNLVNRDRNKTVGKSLKTEIISVPKLDFTRIYEKYSSKKLLIKEIEILSDDDKKETKKDKKNINNEQGQGHGHHHHKHHHHKKKNEILKN